MHPRSQLSLWFLIATALLSAAGLLSVSCVSAEHHIVTRGDDSQHRRGPSFELIDEMGREVAELDWSNEYRVGPYEAEGHVYARCHKLYMTLGHPKGEGQPVVACVRLHPSKSAENGAPAWTQLELGEDDAWFHWFSNGDWKHVRIYLDSSGALQVDPR